MPVYLYCRHDVCVVNAAHKVERPWQGWTCSLYNNKIKEHEEEKRASEWAGRQTGREIHELQEAVFFICFVISFVSFRFILFFPLSKVYNIILNQLNVATQPIFIYKLVQIHIHIVVDSVAKTSSVCVCVRMRLPFLVIFQICLSMKRLRVCMFVQGAQQPHIYVQS